MNIDILNAHCGLGHSPDHACLRVGWLAIAGFASRALGCRTPHCAGSVASSTDCFRSSGSASSRQSQDLGYKPRVDDGSHWLSQSSSSPAHFEPKRRPARCLRCVGYPFSQLELPNSREGAPANQLFFTFRPEIRRDYPLNLSISLSGGKETNKDSPSNGE